MADGKKIPHLKESAEIAGRLLELEIGKFAPQASSSVILKYGETVVLATVVMEPELEKGINFLPLVVDYEERLYAAGKISTSRFIKREGKPSEEAILTGRLVDRAIRPLFPKGLYNNIQIILTVLSVDAKNDPDIVSLLATSIALSISGVPFSGPIGVVRIGRIGQEWVVNPTYSSRQKSDLDLVVAGTENEILMIEAQANEIKEEDLFKAVEFSTKFIKKTIEFQKKLISKIKPKKYQVEEITPSLKLKKEVLSFTAKKLKKAILADKLERDENLNQLRKALLENLEKKFGQEDFEEVKKQTELLLQEGIRALVREETLQGKRVDGRSLDEIRPLKSDCGILPRTHGSGFFERGYTQVLTIATLGSTSAVQVLEGLEPETTKRFMHHYNFPPFSTGEVSRLRFPSRREIGHGSLAEKAILPILPEEEAFPYTIRLVSEILSSDGSTSMASVCGSSLALMDAGVPIKNPVAGISIGLVKEKEKYQLLTDITGLEDFCGDLDFKIAGTENGITAIQMDIKIKGLHLEILKEGILKAKIARKKILEAIKSVISVPKPELSPYAPRVSILKINPEKVREIIGPAGKTINKIIAETGVEIDLSPEGMVKIFSPDAQMMEKAKNWILNLTKEAKVGEIYQGKVTRITDFGAFVEILPGQEGLVHISELAPFRVKNVSDIVKIGQNIPVMVINIDELGRINLSYKATKKVKRIN